MGKEAKGNLCQLQVILSSLLCVHPWIVNRLRPLESSVLWEPGRVCKIWDVYDVRQQSRSPPRQNVISLLNAFNHFQSLGIQLYLTSSMTSFLLYKSLPYLPPPPPLYRPPHFASPSLSSLLISSSFRPPGVFVLQLASGLSPPAYPLTASPQYQLTAYPSLLAPPGSSPASTLP